MPWESLSGLFEVMASWAGGLRTCGTTGSGGWSVITAIIHSNVDDDGVS